MMMHLKATSHVINSVLNRSVVAAFVIVSITVVYSGCQEIFAAYQPHDDYYFVLRSSSFRLGGDYHAPIKEYLYPLFIKVSRLFGFSLRSFEVLCYGLALFGLWMQTSKITKSYSIGWITILPLTVFTYQHPVFRHATYDALQLILIPLTFASTLQIVDSRGNKASLMAAGLIAGCQILTRPEGFLFILPPLVSLLFVSGTEVLKRDAHAERGRLLRRAALLCVIPIAFQQGMSAINKISFGFWAPTIMKSAKFQSALAALMSIEPSDSEVHRYAPVPKASLQRAYAVSPLLRQAQPFFDSNVDGKGWSHQSAFGYRPADGSICGGAFQWALLDASSFAAGPKAKAMLDYLGSLGDEIEAAFERGELAKRRVLSTALGPDFSIFDVPFWSSVWRIGGVLLNYSQPILPSVTRVGRDPLVETDFNRLVLRRTALVEGQGWKMSGWVANFARGCPQKIALDQKAVDAGITITLIERADVSQRIQGADAARAASSLCGFDLSSGGSSRGHLTVEYNGRITAIPLRKLAIVKSGRTYDQGRTHVHIDHGVSRTSEFHLTAARSVAWAAHHFMKVLLIGSAVWLGVMIVSVRARFDIGHYRRELALVAALALSITLPRLGLLAAIDAGMYPGDEPRYLASAAFPLWVLASFTAGCVLRETPRLVSSMLRH